MPCPAGSPERFSQGGLGSGRRCARRGSRHRGTRLGLQAEPLPSQTLRPADRRVLILARGGSTRWGGTAGGRLPSGKPRLALPKSAIPPRAPRPAPAIGEGLLRAHPGRRRSAGKRGGAARAQARLFLDGGRGWGTGAGRSLNVPRT